MRYDDAILKTALLGTKNSALDLDIFPEAVCEHLQPAVTPETAFLDALTLYKRYIESGSELVQRVLPEVKAICEAESKPYTAEAWERLFSLLLSASDEAILVYLPKLLEKLRMRGEIVPPEYLVEAEQRVKGQPFYQETLMAFGHRGAWLYRRLNPEENGTDILDLKAAARKSRFVQIVHDTPQAIAFLDAVFDAESITQKFGYLKVLNDRYHPVDSELLACFETKIGAISSKSKTYLAMVNYLALLHLNDPGSVAFEAYFENCFCHIWEREEKGELGKAVSSEAFRLRPKPQEVLESLLQPLEALEVQSYYTFPLDLEGVDRLLYFVIATVPLDRWCSHFGSSQTQMMEAISAIKPMVSKAKSTNAIEKLNYLQALNVNLVKYNQKAAALALFEHYRFGVVDKQFLRLLEDGEVFTFITRHIDLFDRYENLVRFLARDLKIQTTWTEPLTQSVFRHALRGALDNSAKSDLWHLAPWLPGNFLQLAFQVDSSMQYRMSENLRDTLLEIEKIKSAFENLEKDGT